ncbi:hypothetical protein EQM14_01000 [Caproiciproducens sp. NJN-50]|uniref:hypothetical protein n=1 Tax=Acutalibacteraceae TaxID=3082771 RepID=UPI000FFE316F|nr:MULTISPECIES: hypothetical protein [Acutalibacteraceae]QAT48468.1 hypothetical protein EQM14_01000 [Caproiciproducens sp. NJN-50]
MGKKPFRFTGESYSADGSGTYHLRRETMFESASDSEGDEFREVSSREVMSREEQLRQDTERLGRAEREFAGHP